MSDLRQAAQQALDEMLRVNLAGIFKGELNEAITALRAALAEPDLDHCPKCGGPADNGHDRCIPPNPYFCSKCTAEPEQEPVAWLWPHQLEELQHIHQLGIRAWSGKRYKPDGLVAVYTAPTPRRPLTDEEMRECAQAMDAEPLAEGWPELIKFARAIERAHGIKEQGP